MVDVRELRPSNLNRQRTAEKRFGLVMSSVYRRFGAVQSAIVPEAIQIAVHQSVEKMPSIRLRTEEVWPCDKGFRREHWVFARFVSVRLLRIPGRVLRFYYSRQTQKKGSR
jgi:hypothetical protein